MTQSPKGSRAARLTKLVTYLEQLAEQWQGDLRDPAVASALQERYGPAARDLEATRALIAELMDAPQTKVPRDVLLSLHDALAVLVLLATRPVPAQSVVDTSVIDLASRAKAVQIESTTRKVLKQLRAALLGLGLAAGIVLASPVAAGTAVGDTIVNPETGVSSVILKNEGGGKVITDKYLLILTSLTGLTAKDATDKKEIIDPTVDGGATKVKVVGVTINALTGQATKIRVEGAGGVQRDIITFVDKSAEVGPIVNPPSGPGVVINPPASGDKNVVQDIRVASNGSNGRNGGGFKVFGVVIGVSAGNGGAGTNGEHITTTISSSHGLIETISDNMAGIRVGSVGGGGGRGGDAVFSFGIDGGSGGKAGKGGDVTVTNFTGITTTGAKSHGMHIYSRSGAGGVAGTVQFGVAQGGTGGEGNGGGTVTATNNGAITTQGTGAIGVYAQSLGGESGEGGSSYGIVGIPGSSLQAGTGGTASAYNYASVTTSGTGAHGVMAQSIGGTGGQAGDSVGIVALGNDGAGQGGAGGYALAVNGQGGVILTRGKDAYGLAAQSVGGGGGDGGYAAGLVGLGSKGARPATAAPPRPNSRAMAASSRKIPAATVFSLSRSAAAAVTAASAAVWPASAAAARVVVMVGRSP
ncbi:PE-PGRS family protein [Asticcacaulis biprosthecium C19]|uniref:PE-PGRS family protein n=1 Tax=Asticcacaulis biprosthecium C19 TaxID=715226 RepID=F4QIB1_9CAUL|nr:hypothetical protein [Asticcacaulis biprosthecium]EGF91749.1 PE-PGRS family protein [Asticcacaulis biprosthecium C19]